MKRFPLESVGEGLENTRSNWMLALMASETSASLLAEFAKKNLKSKEFWELIIAHLDNEAARNLLLAYIDDPWIIDMIVRPNWDNEGIRAVIKMALDEYYQYHQLGVEIGEINRQIAVLREEARKATEGMGYFESSELRDSYDERIDALVRKRSVLEQQRANLRKKIPVKSLIVSYRSLWSLMEEVLPLNLIFGCFGHQVGERNVRWFLVRHPSYLKHIENYLELRFRFDRDELECLLRHLLRNSEVAEIAEFLLNSPRYEQVQQVLNSCDPDHDWSLGQAMSEWLDKHKDSRM